VTEKEIRSKIERIQVSEADPETKGIAIQQLQKSLGKHHDDVRKQIEDGKSDPIPTD